MMRRSILWHACVILAPVLAAAALPVTPARAQDRGMQDRLDRLERDLSMLQRQVYRGGPVPIVSAGSGAAVDVELRMDRLETQMRDLTGRVEDAVNGVEQLRRRLEQVNSDIETRFGQTAVSQTPVSQTQGQPRTTVASSRSSAGITDSSPAGPVAMRGPPPGAVAPRPRSPNDALPPGTLVPPPQDMASGAGTLTPPGPTRPAPEPTTASLRPPGRGLPPASASEQYNTAFGLLKQADYPAAEEAMKTFVAQHPNDPLASSAQYWLGETYYARGRYSEAAGAFAEGYKNYPKGTKAADDLLKLAMSLARANQKQNACVALAQLDRDFPHPAGAIKDRATGEKKRLGC